VGAQPYGFPAWLRITHYVSFLFLVLLVCSGLQILADHPRLYWNMHCTPSSEWLRLTPIEVPTDRVWTAKEDSRHLSPWIGLPGYRHTAGGWAVCPNIQECEIERRGASRTTSCLEHTRNECLRAIALAA
jgi:hypothetical protein